MLGLMLMVMVVFLVLGFPLMVPIIAGPLVVVKGYFSSLPVSLLLQQMISGVRLMSLIAIPLFIFAANIMTRGTTADRLITFVVKFVGHLPGGLAIATSGACTGFGSISGSTQATVVAIGQPLLPRLLKFGYSSSYSMALIICASNIALLIPPSIGMILYGVVTGNSVGELFIAGVGPGILILVLFSVYSYFHAKWHKIPLPEKASRGERWTATKRALPSFAFPVLIIGGIYSGIFSPNEAAGVSILYALFLEMVCYKSIKWKEIPDIALETGVITGVVFILLSMGAAFSWVVTFARIPNMILPMVFGTDPGLYHALIIITIAYFLACMFIDNVVVIMVLTPVLYPIAMKVGIDPIALGVIVTLQAAIGAATPPFGCNIFTAIAIFRRPYMEVVRETPVFIAILVIVSGLVMVYPEVGLFLRDIAYGK